MNTRIYRLFNLRSDQQDADVIDSALRSGAQVVGTNLWVLFFAILIASVGLNVNSTAVIIGAMLISPLMGPIVGIGYAAAVADFTLIREAAKNLGIFTALSLITSILYFSLSPLDQPQSELLARTSPTLWDVLIAAFGGAAGMVAVTRRSFNNIVPGVAIATALMPPLCTAGFGIANGRWDFFVGAFYLYVINSVFIAASTLAVAKLLRLPPRGVVDAATRRRHRAIIAAGLTLVLVPSIWLGYKFVQHEVFNNAARNAGSELLLDPRVLSYDIDATAQLIRLTTVGDRDQEQLQEQALAALRRNGLPDAQVQLRRTGDESLDVGALRKDLTEELQRTLISQVQKNDAKVRELEAQLAQTLKRLDAPPAPAPLPRDLLESEIRAQLPQVRAAYLAEPLAPVTVAAPPDAAATAAPTTALVVVTVERPLAARERTTLARWLALRLEREEVIVIDHVLGASRSR
ncbi:MAG: DUF389 domain-containing protein [Hydrogenophaga sp.]|uniref:DUF389 domain-containing protein n=1 Tax=Hydrogenophaga sp. TaxID=1904254 RepID=UPI002773BCD5|nr:DUF389 domain-containing protein [Hydrogenophaga sp.]MDP2417477.1 DUF389 domain-containing protein [Hydrogenophaga sp.]MDZ4187774.1 DUF389 domain-containing protein [Hydrogenophaga sp.]